MFDFAWSHILLLLIIAVIFLGPKELPIVLRYLGKIFAKLRLQREELQEYVEAAFASPPPSSPPASEVAATQSVDHDPKP